MSCVRSRAILLSGILIPAISLFTSRSGFRCRFARLMGFLLEKIGRAAPSALIGAGFAKTLVGSCRNCCQIARPFLPVEESLAPGATVAEVARRHRALGQARRRRRRHIGI